MNDQHFESHEESRHRLLPEAFGDEMLAEYLRAKEEYLNGDNVLLEAYIESRGNKGIPESRTRSDMLMQVNSLILQRQVELGVDPIQGPDQPYETRK